MPAALVSATITLTPVTRRPVIHVVASVYIVFTTLVDPTVLNVSLVTTAMPFSGAADAVLVMSRVLCPHTAPKASATVIKLRAIVPAVPALWKRTAIDVPRTSGVLGAIWAVSRVTVTQPIHYAQTATCLQASATASQLLEVVFALTAKKTTGATQSSSA